MPLNKSYALIAHGQRCAGCESEGDELLEWNGREQLAFLFDSFETMNRFGPTSLCQQCQRAPRN